MQRKVFAGLAFALLVSRIAHLDILWADEDYHLAAAIQMLHGKVPYRDFWYDKPPLAGLAAMLFGAWPGWPLRIVCTLAALAVCRLGYRLAQQWWGEREGLWAAGLLGFFQIFDFPSAVIPWEPDTLIMIPELLAVLCAVRGNAAMAGAASGFAFLLNPKGALVFAVCSLFVEPRRFLRVFAGFVIPCLLMGLWLFSVGALNEYGQQVWRWGMLYAGGQSPDQKGWTALAGWAGFHAALIVGSIAALLRSENRERWRLAGWIGLTLASTLIGVRFAPRYFDLALPALAVVAARGWTLLPRKALALVAILLAVPLVRFGPRYGSLLVEVAKGIPPSWQDVAMDQESQLVADWVNAHSQPNDTITIWGYRPNVVAYTRLPVAGRYWDSQPLTGVPADRHLSDSRTLDADWARANRQALALSSPTFVVDGLSAYNPALDIHLYPELKDWFAGYCEVQKIGLTVIYRKCR